MSSTQIAVWVIAVFVALGAGVYFGWMLDRIRRGAAYQRRDEIVAQAQQEADTIRKAQELASKEELIARREQLERELNRTRDELRDQERRLDRREATIDELQQDITKKERMLEATQRKQTERGEVLDAKETELAQLIREQQEQLFKVSGLSQTAAQDMLLSRLNQELRNETGAIILKHEAELKQTCDKMAREVIGMSVQRYAASHTSETTVSSVDIPNDEMKGRIIGREGRNIRAFEKITGVDVIVDDTPGVVIVSAFDSVRRETAKIALVKLIQDGRIHPTRIEEIVTETQKEMEAHIRHLGQKAAQEAGVHGMHEKLIDLMGRLNFRVSYSQNVLRHSFEVAFLTGMLA